MRYALDTNAIITLLARKSEALLARVLACEAGQIAISSIVAHELSYGACRSRKVAFNLETLRGLLADFIVLDFDREDARVTGEIRAELAAKGTPIGPYGPYDALIAGQAKARGLILVTKNLAEFARVAGLQVEDWTAERQR
jgi:tRNA(fMet)-specific endonuclease VapC